MKALILCAGFGTRLRPHTLHTPKPLFVIGRETVLDRMIDQLIEAGCTDIVVNAHHLAEVIESHIRGRSYGARVVAIREPEILGTGGAIMNLKSFWDSRPFFVVNGDIYTDIDLSSVYRFHESHGHPATLVLCDHPELNTVGVTEHALVAGFRPDENRLAAPVNRLLTFTGIQVLDPEVLEFGASTGFLNSIEIYRSLLDRGKSIAGFMPRHCDWTDIGTPERYRQKALEALVRSVTREPLTSTKLQGDGSDRSWYRLRGPSHSYILADHGIGAESTQGEAGAFIDIGSHLKRKNVRVPAILGYNRFAGLVLVEDLGDENLQSAAGGLSTDSARQALYQKTIDALIEMDCDGYDGFDPSWTCQSREYDADFIVTHECGYFMRAFVAGYLNKTIDPTPLIPEFTRLADGAVGFGVRGFMHRDMQSRNIMIKDGSPWFIDFQGARVGPIQYDLASLLIDPYSALSRDLRERLLHYALRRLRDYRNVEESAFLAGFHHCRVTRNLQILGAFGFLTTKKGKTWFEKYIPAALEGLKEHLSALSEDAFPRLFQLVDSLPVFRQQGFS